MLDFSEIAVGPSSHDIQSQRADCTFNLDGQNGFAIQNANAVQPTIADDGQHSTDTIIGETVAYYRRYTALRQARQRLELQGMALCRSICDGDKVEGVKLYKKPSANVAIWLEPYRQAMVPLDARIADHEKHLSKLGKGLPVNDWMGSINGLSPRFVAMIVGETGIGPGEYKSVSALWKRMGLAVINGERQRRVAGDAAIAHGYVARRRALMWNIGESIIKQQVRNPKGEDGKPLGAAVAIGYYGQVYIDRKAYELIKAETPMQAHNRAKRYMEKRLLRELWKAWGR